MSALAVPAFDTADIAPQLVCMADEEFDALDFGVVEMDHQYKVLRYNAAESRHTGITPGRLIGHHLFRDVAPYANNRQLARRYQIDALDETVAHTFSMHMRMVPVTLRLLKPAYNERMYLLVKW